MGLSCTAAFRNVPRLTYLDASILPSNALPIRASFTLQSFRHDNLIIGIDALAFLSNQPNIKDLCINPYSYYEASQNHHVSPTFRSIQADILFSQCRFTIDA